jgi:hypothetical protein
MTGRFALRGVLPLLVLSAAAACSSAQTPAAASQPARRVEYSAGTTRYRLTTTTKGTQISPMGNQDFQFDARQQLTVSLAKQAPDTLVATATLDSITIKGAQPLPDVSSLLGLTFVSYISPTGKLYSFKKTESANPLVGQVTESVGRFLPTYRADLRPGLSWSDTTSGKVTQQGMEVDRTVTSIYKVVGDTTIGGASAYKIERVSITKAAGSGSAQGQPIALESATNSTAIIFLTSTGVYLGGRQSDDVTVKITILAQGADVSVKQKTESTIEAIK